MRSLPLVAVLLAIAGAAFAADESKPRVELNRSGQVELGTEAQGRITEWSIEFLKSANFNTANQPDVLNKSVAAIQKRYRETVASDYLVISYDRPTTFETIGGDVTVVEIIVGLNRPDAVPSALFTVDPEGRVVAHEKYAAIPVPAELAPQDEVDSAR